MTASYNILLTSASCYTV